VTGSPTSPMQRCASRREGLCGLCSFLCSHGQHACHTAPRKIPSEPREKNLWGKPLVHHSLPRRQIPWVSLLRLERCSLAGVRIGPPEVQARWVPAANRCLDKLQPAGRRAHSCIHSTRVSRNTEQPNLPGF